MACDLGDVQKNLARAPAFVEEAAAKGAQLVLLPELMPGGYTLTEEIWNTAEPFDGTTTRWLRQLGRQLGIYVGTSFLETDGEDFFNAFVLATLKGEIAGRVRRILRRRLRRTSSAREPIRIGLIHPWGE
jgi:N-carbamoylputrescine amidase